MTQITKRRPATPKAAARRPSELDRQLDPEMFKALGDATRVSLLACLAKCGRACTVSEIAACCSVDLSVVSRHLAVLARAGILASRREGRQVLYEVRYTDLSAHLRALAAAIDGCCQPLESSQSCCAPMGPIDATAPMGPMDTTEGNQP